MLKDRAGDQGAQLMMLHQKALRCDQLEEETQQAHDHATMCSREVEVRGERREEGPHL